jgi:hypothetical protein
VVNHKEIDSCLGTNGAMNVHDVEVELNVATFNVQLDESFPQLCGKTVENLLYSKQLFCLSA